MPRLVINHSAGGSDRFEINNLVETIGRHPDNTIVIEDASVSGHHAEIVNEGGKTLLRDLNSTTGTMVNGTPITEVQLSGGDEIRFGPVECSFENALKEEPVAKDDPELAREESAPTASFGSQLAGLGKAAFGEAKRNARMAGLKAKIEKLKLVDLNKAHYGLGKKCFELGLHQDQFPAQWAAIQELEERIKVKREHSSPVEAETTGAKIKRIAGETKQSAEAEGLALKEKQLLTEFGKGIAGLDVHTPDLNTELHSVAAVHSAIQIETDELSKLGESSSDRSALKNLSHSLASDVGSKGSTAARGLWASMRRLRAIAVVGVITLCLVAIGAVKKWRQTSSSKATGSHSTVLLSASKAPPAPPAPLTNSAPLSAKPILTSKATPSIVESRPTSEDKQRNVANNKDPSTTSAKQTQKGAEQGKVQPPSSVEPSANDTKGLSPNTIAAVEEMVKYANEPLVDPGFPTSVKPSYQESVAFVIKKSDLGNRFQRLKLGYGQNSHKLIVSIIDERGLPKNVIVVTPSDLSTDMKVFRATETQFGVFKEYGIVRISCRDGSKKITYFNSGFKMDGNHFDLQCPDLGSARQVANALEHLIRAFGGRPDSFSE